MVSKKSTNNFLIGITTCISVCLFSSSTIVFFNMNEENFSSIAFADGLQSELSIATYFDTNLTLIAITMLVLSLIYFRICLFLISKHGGIR